MFCALSNYLCHFANICIPKFEKFKDIMLHGHGGITPLAKTLIIPEPNRSKVMRNILKHKLKVSKGIINK